MFVPELSGLLDSVPGAVNHANSVLFNVLQIVDGDIFFAKS